MASSIKQQQFGGGSSRVEHYVSTSDQEEEFISVKPRTKKKYTMVVKQPGTKGKEDKMVATSEAMAMDKEAGRPPTPKLDKVTAGRTSLTQMEVEKQRESWRATS